MEGEHELDPQGENAVGQISINQQVALLGASGDMMSRFEALSKAFKHEVEGLVDQEKAASRVTMEQLEVNVSELEQCLTFAQGLAGALMTRLHQHVSQHEPHSLQTVFGSSFGAEGESADNLTELETVFESFLAVREAAENPELAAANAEIVRLKAQVVSRDLEISSLQEDLNEARTLKTQEERDLLEFRALREKDSEILDATQRLRQAEALIQELQAEKQLLTEQVTQSDATLTKKARKVVDLLQDVEKQSAQCKVLSDENNTLRLQLGKDSDYVKVAQSALEEPSMGTLDDVRQAELRELKDELVRAQTKFPGLQMGSDHCKAWCDLQISREADVYRSFLWRLQERAREAPDISWESLLRAKAKQSQDLDATWQQRELAIKEEDAAFQETEKLHAREYEERRVQLVGERDSKVKQLLAQADKAQTKAEKQLLMQQAKLFGQRMDAKIDQLWTEQRQAHQERWMQNNQARQQSRQRFHDETLFTQPEDDGSASVASRFQDTVEARLASAEEAWVRNLDKACAVNATVLKGCDLEECLHAAGLPQAEVPQISSGLQYVGIDGLSEAVEELLRIRISGRRKVHKEMEQHAFTQLRACMDQLVQKETGQRDDDSGKAQSDVSQAKLVKAMLCSRQHRMVAETLRRQFFDFMLILRLASLGAARLLPDQLAENYRLKGAKLDLPSLPKALQEELCGKASDGAAPLSTRGVDVRDDEREAKSSYDALLQRILERLLSPLHSQHRLELLALKRNNSREILCVLQQLCQLEPGAVDEAHEEDVAEYRCQVRTKLLSECEQQASEERRLLWERVEEQVEREVTSYQRRAVEEELEALHDRQKWLSERILLAQRSAQAGDKVLLQRMRAELTACEAKLDRRNEEVAAFQAAARPEVQAPMARPVSAAGRQRPPLPTTSTNCSSPGSSATRPRAAAAFVDEAEELVQATSPSLPSSARPPRSAANSGGKAHRAQRAAQQSPRATSPRGVKTSTSFFGQKGEKPAAQGVIPYQLGSTWPLVSFSDDDVGSQSAGYDPNFPPQPPCFGSPEDSPARRKQSGAALSATVGSPRRTTPSFGAVDVGGGLYGSPPLYEWPFENCVLFEGPEELKSVKSLSGAKHALSESLPPLKSREEPSAYSFPARCNLKSPRNAASALMPAAPLSRGLA
mmetsp:Transcript_10809/g.24458  ORF Transcript_10809/g.24458 Transcript_10809/m.24458 type:complete len:1157 (-) Transcript_10809:9-3479(-)